MQLWNRPVHALSLPKAPPPRGFAFALDLSLAFPCALSSFYVAAPNKTQISTFTRDLSFERQSASRAAAAAAATAPSDAVRALLLWS